MKRYTPLLIILVVFILALAGAWGLLQQNKKRVSSNSIVNHNAPPNATPTTLNTGGANPPHAKGATSAAITLEEFSDLQCPSCKSLHDTLKKMPEVESGLVRVVFRHYPLAQVHPNAMHAARATEAAARQNKFWEMQGYLFQNQAAWSRTADPRGVFLSYANTLGLDGERFARDMQSATIDERIAQDIARGNSLGVGEIGTPTVFVNNRLVPYEQTATPESLRAVFARNGLKR